MIEFLSNNWSLLIVAIAAIFVIFQAVWVFFKLPTSAQIKKVKEWMLYAVLEAEKEFGSGTGQIKLRFVYDKFVEKFPTISVFINFDTFSCLADEALEKLEEILSENDNLNQYIDKGGKE